MEASEMSKRRVTWLTPSKPSSEYCADARPAVSILNASPWAKPPLSFDKDGMQNKCSANISHALQQYQCLALNANVDEIHLKKNISRLKTMPEIDRWILSSLQTLIKKVTAALEIMNLQ
jgi:isoleucyl-tRNA synthetase